MHTTPSQELVELSNHVRAACAALTPLISGNTHDGKALPNPARLLDRALKELDHANALVRQIRKEAGEAQIAAARIAAAKGDVYF